MHDGVQAQRSTDVNLPDPARIVTTERVMSLMRDFVSGKRDPSGPSIAFVAGAAMVGDWIEELRSSGGMVRIENCETHRTSFLNAWNALADGTWDDNDFWNTRARHLGMVSDKLSDLVMMPLFEIKKDDLTIKARDVVEGIAASMRANILAGRAGPYSRLEGETCRISGIRLALGMDGWKPAMGILNRSTHKIEPSCFVAPDPVDHVVVKFKGGPVLVGDWFRIDEFTKAVDPKGVKFDLGTELGAREYVHHYAGLGFVSVSVGNSSPSIIPFEDSFVVGRFDEETEGSEIVPSPLAQVCTDLWRATMIEKDRLIEIVAESIGLYEAETVVEKYLEENGCDGTIDVPAGEYHIYFSGHHGLFIDTFNSEDLPMPPAVQPFFVMTKNELKLSSKPIEESPPFDMH
jgi:hypothetical protein